MSSDYIISKEPLEQAGVTFVRQKCEYSGETVDMATFPEYDAKREVFVEEDNVHICCGGSFRNWLEFDFLPRNHIDFEKH